MTTSRHNHGIGRIAQIGLAILTVISIFLFCSYNKNLQSPLNIKLTAPPSSETHVLGIYPESSYEIELTSMLSHREFEANVRLTDLYFLDISGQRRDSEIPESCVVSNLTLRFYDSLVHKKKRTIDAHVSIIDEPVPCVDVHDDTGSESRIPFFWTPSYSTPALYPFDKYQFCVDIEENIKFPGTVGNAQPEFLTIQCSDHSFVLKQAEPLNGQNRIILTRPLIFRLLSIILVLIIVAFTVSLRSFKDLPVKLLANIGAIWGVRSIVSAGAPVFPTLIDYFSMLAIVAVFTFTIKSSNRKQSQ